MSLSGLCQVCERAEAEHGCEHCGRFVCESHYDPELGFCTRCAAQIRQGRGEGERGVDDENRYR